jgi:phosphatidate phosphatase APP1
MAIGDNGDNGIHLLHAEVRAAHADAQGARAQSTRAIEAVGKVRDDLDASHKDLGDAIAATQADLNGCESRLSDRLTAVETIVKANQTETVGHLTNLYGAVVDLRSQQTAGAKDWHALVVVVLLGLQYCGAG